MGPEWGPIRKKKVLSKKTMTMNSGEDGSGGAWEEASE